MVNTTIVCIFVCSLAYKYAEGVKAPETDQKPK